MTFFRISIVLSVVLCCGLLPGQEPDSVINGDYGDGISGLTLGKGHGSALQEVIQLNEAQQVRLRRVTHALQDALFPLSLEAFQLDWELQRAFRMEPPDVAALTRISAEFERIEGQFESVFAEHRKMARAILSRQQLMALGRLESALELFQAAQEAIYLNLIAAPYAAHPFDEDSVYEPVAEAVRLSEGLARLRARQQGSGTALLQAR
ncbi:MAG: hypothetical protein OXH99_25155 [Bryobacterales bacterium]|nr:hypothetical protein [Bryobacterales bacterium]